MSVQFIPGCWWWIWGVSWSSPLCLLLLWWWDGGRVFEPLHQWWALSSLCLSSPYFTTGQTELLLSNAGPVRPHRYARVHMCTLELKHTSWGTWTHTHTLTLLCLHSYDTNLTHSCIKNGLSSVFFLSSLCVLHSPVIINCFINAVTSLCSVNRGWWSSAFAKAAQEKRCLFTVE